LAKFLPLINLIYILLTPVLGLMKKLSTSQNHEEVSEEDKDDIVERAIETLAESAGISEPIIEEDEKEMIHQIFQLDVTEVEEIMTPRIDIATLDSKATIDQIREEVIALGFSRYPVISENVDNIIGILYVKDLLALNDNQQKRLDLTAHLREPLRVPENRIIDQLLAEFKKSKTHIAIVMDEFGGTAGLVTLEDILEEIVGEIEDEHDPDKQQEIVLLPDGSLETTGTCPLEDVAEKLGLSVNFDDFETVGGMIYDRIGTVPTEGTFLSWENTKFRVLKVEGQRIIKVLITPSAGNHE
jgi:putative hemolysin